MKIDGMTIDELRSLSDEEIDQFVFCKRPITFQIGSAEILGEFRKHGQGMEIELAHIDGGGEGALPLIWKLASDYATSQKHSDLDWYVHAVNCANPNPKLRRVLERKGFQIIEKDGVDVFHLHQKVITE